MRKLEWLVVKDNWLTETAMYWKNAPEIARQRRSADIQTEVFFFPATQVGEYDGSFTNTQRMLQWHSKAADPPGDCRTDTWFYYQLSDRHEHAARIRATPGSGISSGITSLIPGHRPRRRPRASRMLKILREIMGFRRPILSRHLTGFAQLKDDGSTTCASWIYCGVYPAPDRNLRPAREARCTKRRAHLN